MSRRRLWTRTSWTRYLCPRYVDYNSICSTPICHSFYLGILKDLVVNITETRELLASASARAQAAAVDQPNCAPGSFPAEYALSPVARKEVTARHNSMVITQDWNREKRPLLKSRKGFIIEEWARFVEVGDPLFTNVGMVVCYHRSGCVCLQPRQGKWCGISDIHTCVQKIIITCPLQPPPPA